MEDENKTNDSQNESPKKPASVSPSAFASIL